MMATKQPADPAADAPRFSARDYLKLISDDSRLLGIKDIPTELLTDHLGLPVYLESAVHVWRRRSKDEGGYGPVGMPGPDNWEDRSGMRGAAWAPQWFPKTLNKWLIETGRKSAATLTPQQPLFPGRSAATFVDQPPPYPRGSSTRSN